MTGDRWNSGDDYEPYVGRWSRLVAQTFVEWMDVAPGARWVDVGCGTGAIAETALLRAAPLVVSGVDPSEAFVAHASRRLEGRAFEGRVGDAIDLPFGDESFEVAVTGLVLNFVSDPGRAVAEMRRVVHDLGLVGAYVWDYAGRMEMMRYFWDAAVSNDPAAAALDEGRRFPICNPRDLRTLFSEGGLEHVEARSIDVPTVFRDFDDYWTPFLSGQAPAPGYCMSLDDASRADLRELLRARLPTQPDGSIRLIARAWAVRGSRA